MESVGGLVFSKRDTKTKARGLEAQRHEERHAHKNVERDMNGERYRNRRGMLMLVAYRDGICNHKPEPLDEKRRDDDAQAPQRVGENMQVHLPVIIIIIFFITNTNNAKDMVYLVWHCDGCTNLTYIETWNVLKLERNLTYRKLFLTLISLKI